MEIKFANVAKEMNSTLRPDTTNWSSYECHLKDICSVTNPIIEVNIGNFSFINYNMAWIPAWDRFYFITDKNILTGYIVEMHLSIDALGSHKAGILASYQYVSRSASDYSAFLRDPVYSHSSDIFTHSEEIDIGLTTPANGCYIMTVCCDDAAHPSEASYYSPSLMQYVFSPEQLRAFCAYMLNASGSTTDDSFWELMFNGIAADDVTQVIDKSIFNPFQYVIKIMYLPFPLIDIVGAHESTVNVSVGWWQLPPTIKAYHLKLNQGYYASPIFGITSTMWGYTSWTDRAADWSEYTLYIPSFGQITLDSKQAGQTIYGYIYTDLQTGDSILFLKDNEDKVLQTAQGKLGADIQLSNLYTDFVGGTMKAAANIAGAAWSAVTNPVNVAGVISGAAGAIDTVGDMMSPTPSTIGTFSAIGLTSAQKNAIFSYSKYHKYSNLESKVGGMCCKIVQLSTLSGYTECPTPDLALSGCTTEELDIIQSYMRSGFFIN